MHDPTMPPVELQLGDRTLGLVFDFEAIADAEDVLDRPILTGLKQSDVRHPKISLVRAMLFAALRPRHPEIGAEEANALVTRKNLADIWGKLVQAYGLFCAEPEDAAGPPVAQS